MDLAGNTGSSHRLLLQGNGNVYYTLFHLNGHNAADICRTVLAARALE